MEQESKEKLSKWFGINPQSIKWYNAGICYSRIIVFDEEAANKVAEKVKGETVNGGILDGMPLGYIHTYLSEGVRVYDVTC